MQISGNSSIIKVKKHSEKIGPRWNIKETKLMTAGIKNSFKTDNEETEVVGNFYVAVFSNNYQQ